MPEKKIETSEVDLHGGSRKLRRGRISGTNFPGTKEQPDSRKPDLIETMLERGNLLEALRRVEGNRGAAGVDGLTVGQLRQYLRVHWAGIKEQLLKGEYNPPARAAGGHP